jgi:hypothetical protein
MLPPHAVAPHVLRALRERLGEDFAGGVVINLGKRSYTYEDRLHVLPLDTLWR